MTCGTHCPQCGKDGNLPKPPLGYPMKKITIAIMAVVCLTAPAVKASAAGTESPWTIPQIYAGLPANPGDYAYIRSWESVPKNLWPMAAVAIIFKETFRALHQAPAIIADLQTAHIGDSRIAKAEDANCTYRLLVPNGDVAAKIAFDHLSAQYSIIPEGTDDVWIITVAGQGEAVSYTYNLGVPMGAYPGVGSYSALRVMEASSVRAKFFLQNLAFIYAHICSPVEVAPF